MATMQKRENGNGHIQANVLGSSVVSSEVLSEQIHPEGAPLHQIPKDERIEVALSKIENLLGKGHYGTALQEASSLEIGDSPLASQYEFLRHEKLSRTHIGIGDRYFIRGDVKNAKRFYENAIKAETQNPTLGGIVDFADRTFDSLIKERTKLFERLSEIIKTDKYEDWCGTRNRINDLSIVHAADFTKHFQPDFTTDDIFTPRPPVPDPDPWFTREPVETASVGVASAVPGSIFVAGTKTAVNVDVQIPQFTRSEEGTKIRASVAMPVVANVMIAKSRLYALENNLTVTGQTKGVVPLLRYEYLRKKTNEMISRIQDIESRMLPLQFNLDDFAQVVDSIRRPLEAQQAELESANQKIDQLVYILTALTQEEQKVGRVQQALNNFKEEECDLEWYDYLVAAGIFVLNVVAEAGLGALVGLAGLEPITVAVGAIAGAIIGAITGVGTAYAYLDSKINCDNVEQAQSAFGRAQQGLQKANQETQAELNHTLMVRDALIASINTLSFQLNEVYQSNKARLLDAETLTAIQSQYNTLRQSFLTRAQTVAKLTEDAFNFERDLKINVIRDAYYDEDKKGYTSAENLARDLDSIDYIAITGQTQKPLQLTQMISLAKHYPVSFMAIRSTGSGRFTTSMKEFDQWFPGTYMQRIKEVTVEVLVDDKPAPIRGYFSNDGVSFVRFVDRGNKIKVDNVTVFAEPDNDLGKCCYKRLQRRRHIDTMAFPGSNSYLHKERMRQIQDKERNYFENVGLESTWSIELLPDQPFELLQISDIRVNIQYEALFDETLKQVLKKKQYTGRREVIMLSAKQLIEREGKTPDFSGTFSVNVLRSLFEAPVIDKKLVNVGFIVKPKEAYKLDGAAKLEVSFEGAPAVQLETDNTGVVATSKGRTAGNNLANLDTMVQGKNVDGTWNIKIAELPASLNTEAVSDVYLMMNYEYA